MAPSQDTQLEKVIDDMLKSGNVQTLEAFLQSDKCEGTTTKCSHQFLTKLDKLVSRSLDEKNSKSASLGFAILYKCGKNVKLPDGCRGLPGLIAQGLLKKWFEKCRQLWIKCGPQWSETLFNLCEDFFDALMVVHESCKEGTYKITESFLYPIGQLAVDPRIYILIQKEAIRKFNLILDKIPTELKKKKKILTSQEASDLMVKLAGHILEGGDYDLQTALMEALCRMATPAQRKEMADRWFSMEHVATAFVKICDSEFETDCRKFLNLVNGMQGDRRRVYSYPCLEVYLDKYELLMPIDEKLEEFWIDFNLGSRSISFYFSLADEEAQEGQWETICISENEVQSYTVTLSEEGRRHVLHLTLSEVVVVGAVEGSSLTIHFSSLLDILQAAHSVYGHGKHKGFVGKTSTSVVKTTVKIIMEENSSQQVVPESQVSLGESEKNTVPYLLPAPSAPVQMLTPAKVRISESTSIICSSARGSVHGSSSLSAVMPSNTPAKGKGKPSLEMVHSCDRKGECYLGELRMTAKTCSHGTTPNSTVAVGMIEQSDMSLQGTASKQANKNKLDKRKKNIPLAKAANMVPAGQEEEQSLEPSFVPDTQPRSGRNISNFSKLSVSEMLMMPTQKINSLPRPEPCSSLSQQQEHRSSAQRLSVPVHGPISQKQLHAELTQRLQHVLNERNQDPAPEEPAAPQKKMSDIREDCKDRSSVGHCASTVCAPKEQRAQKNGLAKKRRKGLKSVEADAAIIKASDKASTTKVLQEKMPPNVVVKTNRALSSKEKRDGEVTGSMVKLISSRYESRAENHAENTFQRRSPPFVSRPIFNMNWLPTAKKEASGVVSLMKSHSKTVTSYTRQRKDIFAFNIESPLSIGGKDKTFNTSSVSSSGIHDSSVPLSTNKKGQPVAKEKHYVKKHLFSDTDTDHAMTEVSWLRESGRKPKPKVNKYSRQAPIKPRAASPHASSESPAFSPPSKKPVTGNSRPSKKKPVVKERVEQPAAAPVRPHAASRRPQRAAATCTKSYKEPDTEDSQSDSEKPPVSKAGDFLSPYIHSSTDHLESAERTHEAAQVTKKKTVSKQPTRSYVKLGSNPHSNQTESVSEEPSISKKYFVGQQGGNEKTCAEVPEVKKRKRTSSEQSADTCRRQDSNNQSALKKLSGLKQQRPEDVVPETSKLNKRNALKDSWAACQTSFCPCPPSIERMRSAERSAPIVRLTCSPLLTPRGSPLPASPDPPCQATPSPILLLPKPHSTVSSKGKSKPLSSYSAEKKRSSSRTQSIHSVSTLPSLIPIGQNHTGPTAAEMSPVQQPSPPRSPLTLSSLPLLTSTVLELDKPAMPSPPQSPFPEDTINHGHHYGFSQVSSVSQVSLSLSSTKSSVLSDRVKDSPTAVLAITTETSPPPDRDVKPAQRHVSGPSRKRYVSSSSNSEEDEKEERKKSKIRGQHSPRMKPRKLFKSSVGPHGQTQSCGEQGSLGEDENKESRQKDRTFKVIKEIISEQYQNIRNKSVKDTTHDTVAESEVSRVMSSSHTVSSSHWDAEVGDGDMDMEEYMELPKTAVNPSNLCQQFSSELKKKFQNRHKMMEVYNKQSLKTVQQHVSSLSMQVTKYRTQRLEQVREVLLEEISKLEEDDTVLKSMEKDLTMHWKKQIMAFRSYQEQENRRNEILTSALQSNVSHSLEYEERIFTSQMCLIRKDMKSVQDRLLSQMQEGEIQSVKRGLHALFFP